MKYKYTVPPLLPLTPYELVGMIDEVKVLTAKSCPPCPTDAKQWPRVSEGREYRFKRLKYSYTRPISRKKMHTEKSGRTYVVDHDIERYGVDAGYAFKDNLGRRFVFRDNPIGDYELRSDLVWDFFEMPIVKTVAELRPKAFRRMKENCKVLEEINDFKFYPGQLDYISRVACVDQALVCGDVGTGKTCMAIALNSLKNARRTLLVAPKGTVKDSNGNKKKYDPAQWIAEMDKFSPDTQVRTIFCTRDFGKHLRKDGTLPAGVYITYPNAFFLNGGFERIPRSWLVQDRERNFRWKMRELGFNAPYDEEDPPSVENEYHRGVGETRNGFTCILKPSLSSIAGNQFDCVMLDEAHIMQSIDSVVTNAIIRLQPKYRYALTATPIPNVLPNIFPILGWLAVPNWFHGDKSNARWPYALEDQASFCSTFLTRERDFTEEAIRGNGSSCIKICPVISQAQTLLKVLKSLVAFISKEQCNPDVVKCYIETIRLPLGYAQKKLYAHNLDIKNIPYNDPKTCYGVQLQRLRGICADPMGRSFNDGIVRSNFNPKLITTLELIHQYLSKREQVIHISACIGQTDELANRLGESDISFSRIDSKASDHAGEANAFRRKDTHVMLMGAKCAVGHSFPECPNMIIGSFEWSYGSFHQALGRVYRVNSRQDANIKVLLSKDTIEESMFDKLADKRDAATMCILGEYVPIDYKDGDLDEILAEHHLSFDVDKIETKSEIEMELKWMDLCEKLSDQSGSLLLEVL